MLLIEYSKRVLEFNYLIYVPISHMVLTWKGIKSTVKHDDAR